MAKLRSYRLPWVDVPGNVRWYGFTGWQGFTILQTLLGIVWHNHPDASVSTALAIAASSVLEEDMREPHARVLLGLLAIVDGNVPAKPEEWQKAGACLLCTLPMSRRALLYYICCDRLGYDPAESDVQPERL